MKYRIIIGVLLVIIAGLVSSFTYYIFSTRTVLIEGSGCNKVEIYSLKDGDRKLTKSVALQSTVRLSADLDYEASCAPEDGYVETTASIGSEDDSVSLVPDFNQERQDKLIAEQTEPILSLVRSEYPGSEDYNVTVVNSQNRGSFFTVLLKASDKVDLSHNDTLRAVVAMDSSGNLSFATKPEVSLSIYSYPDISKEVLSIANTYN